MFLKSSKVKTLKDSRIRFQRRAFKSSLKQARNYKRHCKFSSADPNPKNKLILSVGITVLIAIVIYLIYLPNIFSVKTINITGPDTKKTAEIKVLLANYFMRDKWQPQNNLLVLSNSNLEKFLISDDPDLLKVNSIAKHWPNKLDIALTMRQNKYFLTAPDGQYIISNDFFVSTMQDKMPIASSSLKHINLISPGLITPNSPYPNLNQLNAIEYLQDKLPDSISEKIDYIEIKDLKGLDITVFSAGGAKFLFNYNTDLSDTLQKLHLLLTSIDPRDKKNLAYVDMRIQNRGYVCLKGTPCAKLPVLSNVPSTPVTASTAPETTIAP